ncbi:MAG TPA: hypothetical protein VGO93_26435, partial [Candidatus Xenobia bacterium]
MGKEPKHKWTFAPRFRARAFGWKSQPAIKRVREAVAEIRKMAKRDPILGAEGAILFLEKVSPALEQVDGSSGAIGLAVNHAVDEMVSIIVRAPADEKLRDKWVERLWEAYQDDQIPYIESLADSWGDLCATTERASHWADELLPTVKMVWNEPAGYFHGTPACLSCLLAAGRCQELLDLLDISRHVFWHDRQFGVRALAVMGRVDDAIAYAERSLGSNDGPSQMSILCEKMLLEAGRSDEAYERYAIAANQGISRLATFRAISKKYPDRDSKHIIRDLIRSTPGEEGKWFATASDLKLYDLAVALARQSPCEPKTLNRAAREMAQGLPAFSLEVALVSLHWLSQGYGWEVTSLDVLGAFDQALSAAQCLGREDEVMRRLEQIISRDHSAGMF